MKEGPIARDSGPSALDIRLTVENRAGDSNGHSGHSALDIRHTVENRGVQTVQKEKGHSCGYPASFCFAALPDPLCSQLSRIIFVRGPPASCGVLS